MNWSDRLKQNGVNSVQALIQKHKGVRAAARALNLPHVRIQEALLKEQANSLTSRKRVFYFTDTHLDEHLETDHLVWIGKWIKDGNPDYVVHGGDLINIDSISTHNEFHSLEGQQKPKLLRDFEAMERGMELINEHSGGRQVHVTLGNHEVRIWDYENRRPEMQGFVSTRFDDIFKRCGWTYTPYGRYYTLHGVDFVHAPMPVAGRPSGGLNVVQNVARDSVADVVFGHTHCMGTTTRKKLGNDRYVTAINAGCTMPLGYIPRYTGEGSTGWWHGVVELVIDCGKIVSYNMVDLHSLRERYK